MTDRKIHIVFISAFSLCLAYGCWLYVSHFVIDGHYKKLSLRHLIQPSRISGPYEAELSRTLSRDQHWSLHGLAYLKHKFLKTGITSKVLIGQDDWLFLQEEDGRKVLHQSLRIYRYTPLELRSWCLNIRQRNFWAHKYGIDYVLAIAPNKASIYPEYLPERFHSPTRSRSLDQLIADLPDITIIDLTDSIRNRKSQGLLYYPTDTHWNATGAYWGYRALMQRLPPPYATTPLSRTELYIRDSMQRNGDLNRMALAISDRREKVDYPVPVSTRTQSREEKAESAGVSINTQVFTQADTSLARVVFDHDSYLKDFEPLFAEHFSESTFLWGFQDFHADLIRRKQVDLVVDEFVERALIGPTPRNEWPVIQEFWAEHFDTLAPFIQLDDLSFPELIPALQKLDLPTDRIAVLRIHSKPRETDKLVIDYGTEQGYYWLREEGDVYYLEYDSKQVQNFRVENQTPHTIKVEVRLY
ncbi:alginate O-acetyltransferase AlgX-related protein [Flavilitoribacter nigricans]|uniref:alginate O-acetyltransferase AlgX-related protein n=1 Tax=Flavilitoribacter nigricans TaxID=70997 RepID=UPI001472AC6D|nr:hypothetical protein [Flavilitoribacter nigricans]